MSDLAAAVGPQVLRVLGDNPTQEQLRCYKCGKLLVPSKHLPDRFVEVNTSMLSGVDTHPHHPTKEGCVRKPKEKT